MIEGRQGSQYRAVPADPEAVTVCGLDAQAGVEALVDEECPVCRAAPRGGWGIPRRLASGTSFAPISVSTSGGLLRHG